MRCVGLLDGCIKLRWMDGSIKKGRLDGCVK